MSLPYARINSENAVNVTPIRILQITMTFNEIHPIKAYMYAAYHTHNYITYIDIVSTALITPLHFVKYRNSFSSCHILKYMNKMNCFIS